MRSAEDYSGGWLLDLTAQKAEWLDYRGVKPLCGHPSSAEGGSPVMVIRWYDPDRGWLALVPWEPRLGLGEITLEQAITEWGDVPF